jgi:hypothetical protein
VTGLKRPIMGEIAAEYGDVVIVTSDNPRTEDPSRIITDIQVGIEKVRKDYIVDVDRKNAICRRSKCQSGDLVVIAGKGHETYQIFRDKTIHFDDAEVAREALHTRKNHGLKQCGLSLIFKFKIVKGEITCLMRYSPPASSALDWWLVPTIVQRKLPF